MAWMGAAIAGGASLIGGLMRNQSQQGMSDAQMNYGYAMSSSAYQRAVRDLGAAGLNPMLAYSQGGAQTPGAALANIENVLGPAATSAVDAYKTQQAVETQKQQVEQSRAQTELIRAQASVADAQAANTRIDTVMKQSQTRYWDVMAPKIIADTNLSKAEKDKALAWISQAKLQNFNIIADTGNKNVDNVLKQLKMNESEAYSGFFGSPMGKLSPYIDKGADWGSSAARILKPGISIDKSGSTYNSNTTNYRLP